MVRAFNISIQRANPGEQLGASFVREYAQLFTWFVKFVIDIRDLDP